MVIWGTILDTGTLLGVQNTLPSPAQPFSTSLSYVQGRVVKRWLTPCGSELLLKSRQTGSVPAGQAPFQAGIALNWIPLNSQPLSAAFSDWHSASSAV